MKCQRFSPMPLATLGTDAPRAGCEKSALNANLAPSLARHVGITARFAFLGGPEPDVCQQPLLADYCRL